MRPGSDVEAAGPQEVDGAGAVEQEDELHATVRVPREQSARVTGAMLSALPVADVAIDEVEADEVIRQLFSGVPGRGDKEVAN